MIRFNLGEFNIGTDDYYVELNATSIISERIEGVILTKFVDAESALTEILQAEIKGSTFNFGIIGSSFNVGGFNTMSFNSSNDMYRYLDAESIIHEHMGGLIGQTKIISVISRIREQLDVRANPSAILPNSVQLYERITHEPLELLVYAFNESNMQERVTGQMHSGKIMYQLPNIKEVIENNSHAGKIFYTEFEIKEILEGNVHVGKIMWEESDLYEIINNFLRIALRRYQTFFISGEMPPGSELRVDSNNFTVFLNHRGQTINLRSRFIGDWIHFDRNTQRLHVGHQGNPRLEGDVIYNDRWL
ncbi:MAG: hypothetical protein FWC91_01940 [Defluviitaleaceae bacterium]|nr:hypothetical protein [Defluviitaleaceae bacterium]